MIVVLDAFRGRAPQPNELLQRFIISAIAALAVYAAAGWTLTMHAPPGF